MQHRDVFLHRLPGWEPNSYGYHGDDGHIYHGEGKGKLYGHPFGTGDVIGVCVDRVQRRLSFYKNGMACGVAFENLSTGELYPCVGFRSRDASMRINLGSEPPKCVPMRQHCLHALDRRFLHRTVGACIGSLVPPVGPTTNGITVSIHCV